MDQVKKMIIACIVSCKGGVPVTRIDNEYQQLVGTKIPYAKYGFPSLEDLIQSIAEVIMVQNPDGSTILKARDTKTSHIATLVEKQKTTGNARKKVTNCYQMSVAGRNYIRGTSCHQNYGNNKGNNSRNMEMVTPACVTQEDYKIAKNGKQEMGQIRILHAESLKRPTGKGGTQGIYMDAEKYVRKENEVHRYQRKHPLKTCNRHFQQKNSTDKIQAVEDCHEEFNRSQVKVKNQRRISVDDTILVTIVNNYYQSSSNEECSYQRSSLASDWRAGEEEEEIEEDQLCRGRHHHQGYSREFSTMRKKYRMKPSRLGDAVDYYEELYVQKKWIEDSANDGAENVSGLYVREDNDYTHYKRDVSRNKPGLLIKVKNEYAIDRHLYTAI